MPNLYWSIEICRFAYEKVERLVNLGNALGIAYLSPMHRERKQVLPRRELVDDAESTAIPPYTLGKWRTDNRKPAVRQLLTPVAVERF